MFFVLGYRMKFVALHIIYLERTMIEVMESALQKAAGEGMDEFIQVFTDKYKEVIGGELTAETMPLLTGEQHSLLAYQIFRDEIMVGGFCQLIQNGYGGYIFDNPFAKVMRSWGADELSKLVYKAKKYMMSTEKTWRRNGQMMNLWLCTSSMRCLMHWRMSFWKKRRNIQRWLPVM